MQQARFALMIAEGKQKLSKKKKIKLKLSKKMDDWFPDLKIGSKDKNVKPDFGDSPSYHRSICPLMLTTSTLETYFSFFLFIYAVTWLGIVDRWRATLFDLGQSRGTELLMQITGIYLFDFFVYVLISVLIIRRRGKVTIKRKKRPNE